MHPQAWRGWVRLGAAMSARSDYRVQIPLAVGFEGIVPREKNKCCDC